ncbi:MAG: saccharopine dehydrogenase C-terminal domain-containing protein [Ignavibacteria bacterium]
MKILILGAGLIGTPMAMDLAKDKEFKITLVDFDKSKLEKVENHKNIITLEEDLSKGENVSKVIKDADFVLSAMPSSMGFETLKSVIENGKNIVDITFAQENPRELDNLAKSKNVTAIVDCGVAPGMSNLLAGYVDSILDKTENIEIYVGGLPQKREWPYEYKAVFAPSDVIEEYTRPARYIKNKKVITKEALSEPEIITFPEVGGLEAFNSDGLRSLLYNIDAPNKKEKTLRYPGHIEIMKIFRETGFFDKNEIEVSGKKIKPLDFTSKLLFPKWEMKENDRDVTFMRVIVEGQKENKKVKYQYDLIDKYDEKNKTSSMARTTGYTATMAIRMLVKDLFNWKGICPPELIGENHKCVDFILNGLKKRNINYNLSVS